MAIAILAATCPAAAETRLRGMQLSTTVTAQDISDLAAWGANLVRYQLHWADFDAADAADKTAYDQWLETALTHFDELQPFFKTHQLKVILNLHTPPGGFVRRDSKATHRIFVEPWAQTALVQAWEKITARYRDAANIVGFDLLNEPAEYTVPEPPLKSWTELAGEIVSAIRIIDPARTVIVSPAYGDPRKLAALGRLPFENIIYTIHFYRPWTFLHQGIDGIRTGQPYPTDKFNRRYLARQLRPVRSFQQQQGIPIYVGEFTANRWAPRNSGFRYLRDLLLLFEQYGWDWTYHAFREAHPWDVELGSRRKNLTPPAQPTNRKQLLLEYFARNS